MQELLTEILKLGGLNAIFMVVSCLLGWYVIRIETICRQERKEHREDLLKRNDQLIAVLEANTRAIADNTTFMRAKLERPASLRERVGD